MRKTRIITQMRIGVLIGCLGTATAHKSEAGYKSQYMYAQLWYITGSRFKRQNSYEHKWRLASLLMRLLVDCVLTLRLIVYTLNRYIGRQLENERLKDAAEHLIIIFLITLINGSGSFHACVLEEVGRPTPYGYPTQALSFLGIVRHYLADPREACCIAYALEVSSDT